MKKINLKNVAAIVACLTEITVFSGCERRNPRKLKSTMTALIIVVAAILMLSSCSAGLKMHYSSVTQSTTPFFLAYDSEEIIRDQSKVATITSSSGLEINGVIVNSQNMRSANSNINNRRPSKVVVDVMPGTYNVRVINLNQATQVGHITYTFEAGKIYAIGPVLTSVQISENDSDDVK